MRSTSKKQPLLTVHLTGDAGCWRISPWNIETTADIGRKRIRQWLDYSPGLDCWRFYHDRMGRHFIRTCDGLGRYAVDDAKRGCFRERRERR